MSFSQSFMLLLFAKHGSTTYTSNDDPDPKVGLPLRNEPFRSAHFEYLYMIFSFSGAFSGILQF
jgi:hypothetical protein